MLCKEHCRAGGCCEMTPWLKVSSEAGGQSSSVTLLVPKKYSYFTIAMHPGVSYFLQEPERFYC